jgi:hypothetical protein
MSGNTTGERLGVPCRPVTLLVDAPCAGCDKLDAVAVGVTEVKTLAPERGVHLAFNLHACSVEAHAPRRQVVTVDSECHMKLPLAVVCGNASAGTICGLRTRPDPEQQQDVPRSYGERMQPPLLAVDPPQPEHALVKPLRSIEIRNVQRRFDNAMNLRHG